MSTMSILTRARTVAAIGIAGAALLVAGCSSETLTEQLVERAASAVAGEDVEFDIDGDSGTLRISGEDGEIEFGTTSTLPDDFPEGFPLPSGHQILASHRFGDSESLTLSVTMTADGTVDEVGSFYRERLAAGGHEITMDNQSTMGDFHTVQLGVVFGEYEGLVAITDMGDEGTTVQAHLTK